MGLRLDWILRTMWNLWKDQYWDGKLSCLWKSTAHPAEAGALGLEWHQSAWKFESPGQHLSNSYENTEGRNLDSSRWSENLCFQKL